MLFQSIIKNKEFIFGKDIRN